MKYPLHIKLSILLIFFACSTVFAQRSHLSVSFKNSKLFIDHHDIDTVWEQREVTKYWGKAHRSVEGSNAEKINIYDADGLCIWANGAKIPQVLELFFLLAPDTSLYKEWFPKNSFSGELEIDGIKINSNTNLKELIQGLPQYNIIWLDEYVYSGISKGLLISAKTDTEREKLVWLTIGFGLDYRYTKGGLRN